MIEARFDDLLSAIPRGRSFAAPRETIEARTPSEVAPAVRAAEDAAAAGSWVAGFVSYEAAPGFDPTHLRAVVAAPGGDPGIDPAGVQQADKEE